MRASATGMRRLAVGLFLLVPAAVAESDDAQSTPMTKQERTQAKLDAFTKEYTLKQTRDLMARGMRKWQPDPASPVTDLNMFNWEETTAGKTTLVMFYGPSCFYCKELRPIWEEFARQDNGFRVAWIDATAAYTLTQAFKANPWPSLQLIKDGNAYAMPDARKPRDFAEYTEFASTGYTKIDGNPMPKELKLFKGEHFVTIDDDKKDSSKNGERRVDL